MLGELLARAQDSHVWLVNTGWTGGAYGVGKRMKLAHTRAMVRALLGGKLDGVPSDDGPDFRPRRPDGGAEACPSDVLRRAHHVDRRRRVRRAGQEAGGHVPRRTSRSSRQSIRRGRRRSARLGTSARTGGVDAGVTCVRDHPRPALEQHPGRSSAMRLLDTGVVQRLRYVRQLGLAYLVYPGATHSRFEHALGTYHLARRTLALLRGARRVAVRRGRCGAVVPAAALLHDVGHYPFSHALEEIGRRTTRRWRARWSPRARSPASCAALGSHRRPGADCDLIRGTSASPLQGLISGSLDLDKIEYLKRDALMCGVPYGEIDVDRLTHSLVLVPDPDSGDATLGVVEKGLAALESLLFAKYQMYRNVYWHHAVRSATAMYKRLVGDALDRGCAPGRRHCRLHR